MTSVAQKRKLGNHCNVIIFKYSKKRTYLSPYRYQFRGSIFCRTENGKKDEIFTPLGKHISFPAQELSYYFHFPKKKENHFYTGFVFFFKVSVQLKPII